MTTKFPSSPVSSRAARLVARPTVSAFLFCRGSTAACRVKTSITTRPYFVFPRVFWLKSMRSACSRSLGRLAQRAGPWRLHLPAHVGLQRLEGHGLRHVEVALPRRSRAGRVEVPRLGATSSFPWSTWPGWSAAAPGRREPADGSRAPPGTPAALRARRAPGRGTGGGRSCATVKR